MSQTFYLICHETKKMIWIGQGGKEMRIFYSGVPATMIALKRFLNDHRGKQLCFEREEWINECDYEDYSDPCPVSLSQVVDLLRGEVVKANVDTEIRLENNC